MKSAEQAVVLEPTVAPINDGNPEFIIHHSDAVQDPIKAQVMAEASKDQVEAHIAYKSEAKVRRRQAVGPGGGDPWLLTLAADANRTAKHYKKAANNRQEIAGLAYDHGYDVVITPQGAAKSVGKFRRIGKKVLGRA